MRSWSFRGHAKPSPLPVPVDRSPPVREGDVIAGKYVIERVIAFGGKGVLVAARHQVLDGQVVFKFVQPSFLRGERVAERFLREARGIAHQERARGQGDGLRRARKRLAVHDDGVSRGQRPRESTRTARSAVAERMRRLPAAGAGGPGRSARQRHRASRSQAFEPVFLRTCF
jgi:hypothetical protein